MEQLPAIKKVIKELLDPIIEDAVRRAMVQYFSGIVDNPTTTNEVMDVNGVANYLNLTKSAIYSMTHKREIVHYKRGKKLYFYKSDMEDFIRQGRVKTMEEIEQEASNYIIRRKR